MNKYTTFTLLLAILAFAGCKDNAVVNPLDAPTADALKGSLTRVALQQLATGVLAQDRAAVVGTFTHYVLSAILARDVYRIDASEPRYVSETLGSNPDPGSFAGSGGWGQFYTGIRAANTIILALPTAAPTELSVAERNAAFGFMRTIKALDYYRLAELRDTVGISIQTDNENEVTPIRCKTPVLTYVAALLDSALTDLNAAGATTKVPFVLPTGFTAFGRDYGLVSNIILFNRGLKGKVDFYRGLDRTNPQPALFAQSITALTTALGGAAAGTVPPARFSFGPYYNFVPGGTEATANNRADAKIGLNPQVRDSIQPLDTRASKIVDRPVLSGGGLTTTITFVGALATSANQSAPIGILRDEELVLLRAQAEFEAGLFTEGTADLNSVRTNYGLLPYAVFTDLASARSAALYEKRYSLLFEGPQRLVDLRGYGRLNATYLKRELPGDPFNAAFPIPKVEADARNNQIACS